MNDIKLPPEEFYLWRDLQRKLPHMLEYPEKYSTEELSIALDGLYQYGDPTNLQYIHDKSLLKHIINQRTEK